MFLYISGIPKSEWSDIKRCHVTSCLEHLDTSTEAHLVRGMTGGNILRTNVISPYY